MYYGERLNSISHLVGAVLALVGLGALLAVAIQVGRPRVITGFSIFGFTLVLLYTMSTLYHSFPFPRLKNLFKVLDHISIYLLIAGSYTPFMLISMPADSGLRILTLVWVLAIVGTLSEVFRNTSVKRVCQVDLCSLYEHKHQDLSLSDPKQGLMKMATDILTSIFRTLASRGTVFHAGHFNTLRSAYLRAAQDCIRQYHADALINGLRYDRHVEEHGVEGFARQIMVAGDIFENDPTGGEAIPNWARVLAAFRDFPQRIRRAAAEDAAEHTT